MGTLTIPLWRWMALMRGLRRRSGGEREAGAFLLSNSRSERVRHVLFYDELDPQAFASGAIMMDGKGYLKLWEYCKRKHARVVADIHTHPGAWTGQSPIDMRNPAISQVNHIALIVPYFAQSRMQGLRGVGIHEYLGDHKWRTWEHNARRVKLAAI